MMKTMVYNGTFDGFLTAIFEVYEYKYCDAKIVKESVYHTCNIWKRPHCRNQS